MFRIKNGYLELLVIRNIPVYFHWSLPIIGFLIFIPFSLEWLELLYFTIGYIALICIHEFGHALAAKIIGLKIYHVELFGTGGMCNTENPKTIKAGLLCSSGGLIAQAVLLLIVMLYLSIFDYPKNQFWNTMVLTSTVVNTILIFLNIIPIKLSNGMSTDGYAIWKLLTLKRV